MICSYVRRSALWIGAALALSTAGCGGDSTGPSDNGGGGGTGGEPVATTSVAVQSSLSFSPAAIKVSPGATVTWTWEAGAGITHNVTFADASIASSGNMSSGTYQTAMPTTPGTYNYRCTIHSGMEGSVTVE